MDRAPDLSAERQRRDMEATRASISETVGELRQKVGEAMQWQTYVERYPTPILGGAALVGILVGRRIARGLGANDHGGARSRWRGRAASADAIALVTARLDTPGSDRFGAVSASWQKLGSRVEGLVHRVIDEVVDAAERALVPLLVGGVQAVFEGRRGDGGHRPVPRDGASMTPAGQGRLT